ncbi:hypothetical protein ACN4EE_21830, partial [Geminocystis sp. CENA526]|uniref:hypothetical protein n=1 Tax=Geminocystis sp. CENA526 TaxID=1355871 RepID=UPI003D700060
MFWKIFTKRIFKWGCWGQILFLLCFGGFSSASAQEDKTPNLTTSHGESSLIANKVSELKFDRLIAQEIAPQNSIKINESDFLKLKDIPNVAFPEVLESGEKNPSETTVNQDKTTQLSFDRNFKLKADTNSFINNWELNENKIN